MMGRDSGMLYIRTVSLAWLPTGLNSVIIDVISSKSEAVLVLQTWAGHPENKRKAQDILVKLAKANSEAQLGQYKGPHPVPGGQRILQALRLGGSGT